MSFISVDRLQRKRMTGDMHRALQESEPKHKGKVRVKTIWAWFLLLPLSTSPSMGSMYQAVVDKYPVVIFYWFIVVANYKQMCSAKN